MAEMQLSHWQRAGWGLADMGIVVFVVVKQLLVLAFLTNYLGIPIQTAGFLTTAVLIFDLISDPLVGYLSDRTNSRWGRRAPWMFLGAPILVGGIYGVFAVPEGLDQSMTMLWVVWLFGLATIGFTMVTIPYGAMAGEMTQDPKERSVLTAWRMGFASLGILIGGAVIPGLAGDSREGFAAATLMVAPVIVLAIWISIYATRRAPRIDAPATERYWPMVRLVISNRAFVVLTVLYGIMTLAIALITAGLPFATQHLIRDDGGSVLSGVASGLGLFPLLFAAFVLGSILSQAVWVVLSNRLGKRSALVVGLLLYCGLLGLMYSALPSVNITLFAGIFLLAGMTNGAYQQIPWAMYPDLMDQTREESGAAIEGVFSGIWLLGQKFANAIAPLTLSVILGAYGWKETTEGATEQSAAAIEALRVAMTLVPVGILVVAILGLVLIYRPARHG